MSVRDAVEGDLLALPAALQDCALAAAARVLAERLQDAGARDAAAVAKELRATMAELQALASAAPEEVDPLDDLSKARAARIANAALSDRAAGGDVSGS